MAQSKPVRIVRFQEGDDNDLDFFEGDFKNLFSHEVLKDRVVSVISIVGAFRTGKSFLLDFMLRYLYANYNSVNSIKSPLTQQTNWMGDKNDPLKGFKWQCGSMRITTGINMWSDIFLHDKDDGEKLAIVLMDTQGLFDHKTSNINGSRIFCLSTLISSMQIYNIFYRVEENQLQYLQFATGFAKYVQQMQESAKTIKPFQKLMFLIRDWSSPHESAYGLEGGQKYIADVLKFDSKDSSSPAEIKSLREYIHSSFEKIESFLLPHPGKIVVTNKDYDGRWSEMDEEFHEHLKDLVEHVLCPSKLVVKKINGKTVRVEDFKQYVCTFVKLAQSDTLPAPKSIFESTIEIQLQQLNSKHLEIYQQEFELKAKTLMDIQNILPLHQLLKQKVMEMYKKEPKMGTDEFKMKLYSILDRSIDETYKKISSDLKQKIELKQKRLEAEQAMMKIKIAQDRENDLNRKLKIAQEAQEKQRISLIEEQRKQKEAAQVAARIQIEAQAKENELNRKLKIAQDERERQSLEYRDQLKKQRDDNEAREAAERSNRMWRENQMGMMFQMQNQPRMAPLEHSMRSMSMNSSRSSSGQCNGTTVKGARCRNSGSNGGYCHHHC